MYYHLGVDDPFIGQWARDLENLPYALKKHNARRPHLNDRDLKLARMGFYAQCTYIDHQIRLLIGTLREEGLLDNTVIMFVSDHGDMLGNHNIWAKSNMHEGSARIPMILIPTADNSEVGHHRTDNRLSELRDVIPTLLDLCHIPIPETVEGHSLISDSSRDHLYCEHFEDDRSMRMVRDKRFKLIWYPIGNRLQLFDLQNDPHELCDLSSEAEHQSTLDQLSGLLLENLYGSDLKWVKNGGLVGEPDKEFQPTPNRDLTGQRGWR